MPRAAALLPVDPMIHAAMVRARAAPRRVACCAIPAHRADPDATVPRSGRGSLRSYDRRRRRGWQRDWRKRRGRGGSQCQECLACLVAARVETERILELDRGTRRVTFGQQRLPLIEVGGIQLVAVDQIAAL